MYRSLCICILASASGLLVGSLHADAEISQIDLSKNSVVRLSDFSWQFYWKKFIKPADFVDGAMTPDAIMRPVSIWNGKVVAGEKISSFGYATYRLKLRTAPMGEKLALRLPAPLTSYRIFINGTKLGEEGVLTENAETFRPRRKSALIFFTPAEEYLDIVIHVANFMLYKGGLRGSIELGRADIMQTFGMRYLAIDLFCIGLIFSIMIYHFFIYLLMRKSFSTLIFVSLAFDYFLLAFLFGEQSISLFIPELPFKLHSALESALAYVLPPLVLEFTARLYPGTVHPRVTRIYWIAAAVVSVLVFFPPLYRSTYNVYYYGIIGGTAGILAIVGSLRAMRQRLPGARLLAAGLLFLVALTIYAVYLFATHSIAGSFLSIGFACFALFQSGSLAHAHAALEQRNIEMHHRLDRSRLALENQRRRIEANLHDSLGGNLTDIKLGLEALGRNRKAKHFKTDIDRLDHRVAGTIGSLRTELLFLEDLQLAMKDFISGINLILLRRYQMAKRKIDIQISPETRESGRRLEEQGKMSEEAKVDLCMIMQELCNNNLKYGSGTAEWKINVDANQMQIALKSPARRLLGAKGLGHETLRERVQKIGGEFWENSGGRTYEATLKIIW